MRTIGSTPSHLTSQPLIMHCEAISSCARSIRASASTIMTSISKTRQLSYCPPATILGVSHSWIAVLLTIWKAPTFTVSFHLFHYDDRQQVYINCDISNTKLTPFLHRCSLILSKYKLTTSAMQSQHGLESRNYISTPVYLLTCLVTISETSVSPGGTDNISNIIGLVSINIKHIK